MPLQDGLYLVEAMSPCEADVFTKELVYREGECRTPGETLPEIIESCRRRRVQALVWLDDTYIGGTWFDLDIKRWIAELNGVVWQEQEEMENLLRL